jgi:predicted membrane-bound spermidine synthase
MAVSGLNASLLIVHPSEKSKYIVNLDPQIIELIQEAKCLQKMNLEVHGSALALLAIEDRIRKIRETCVLCLPVHYLSLPHRELFANLYRQYIVRSQS